MLLKNLATIIIGILFGTITGLTPGLHINTVNQLLLNLTQINAFTLSIIIIAMSLTHTFLDSIPSIFLGVPDSDSIILLPGHRLVKEGKGITAVNLTLIGSSTGGSLLTNLKMIRDAAADVTVHVSYF